MFLKSIEIFGFKSFADKSRVEFTDGIAALVGPNGCGKSNVVDAIKWVLGEQGTKSLRADRMEDVIFNGTENRKALNVAEVTLTLANDQGVLPIDMPEVAVKRRLFRSGDSEYFINNQPVRLKELRELFYDTGIGKSSYSIMEQGKIDQILSNKPEERRYIFEEAAAITRFKLRGKEAERKLERTEDNMRQVESVIGEVKRSYDSLKRQSEKTLKHRELRDQSFELELDIQLLRLKGYLEEQDKRKDLLGKRTSDRDSVKSEIDGINASLEENLDQVNSMEGELVETQKNLYAAELERNTIEGRIRLLSERSQELNEKIESDERRADRTRGKIADLSADTARIEGEIADYETRLGEAETQINEFDEALKGAAQRIAANDSRIRELETITTEQEAREEQLQGEMRSLTDSIVSELDRGLLQSGYSTGRRSALEDELAHAMDELVVAAEGKRNLFGDLSDYTELGAERATGLLKTAAEGFVALEARIAELRDILTRYRAIIPSFLDEFLAPEGIITRKREIDESIVACRTEIRNAKEERGALTEENRKLQQKIAEYRSTLEELRLGRERVRARRHAVLEAHERTKRERGEQESLLSDTEQQISDSRKRLDESAQEMEELKTRHAERRRGEDSLREALSRLEKTISTKNHDLLQKEQRVKSLMQTLEKRQGEVERLQMAVTEIASDIRNTYSNFEERHSRDLREYESRLLGLKVPAKDLRDELARVREQVRELGTVNFMAPEEFNEVSERYEFLSGQLEDLRKAREDLAAVTAEIQSESAQLFAETFNRIRKNFHNIFRRLFGGGRAEIRLTEPDNVLESGIEILVQPPGKKLESIELLSGGERSLTAVGMLFATFMVKPSPFCLLDEIDAALDESNVSRFVSMLSEFSQNSQFIVITHNKKTIAGSRTLLGVTMEESGVSKVVSIRIGAEQEAYA